MNRRVELLLFAAGWGANHFATLLVVYRKDLALSPSALGILFGAYALGLVPGLLLAGRASDRRGRRAIVVPASLLAIVASVVLAFGAHGFAVLLAGRLLYGLAMGSVMSPGSVWVQELLSQDGAAGAAGAAAGARRATLALSAGFGFGPLASGVVAEIAPLPMVVPYVAHVLAMAAAVVAVRPVAETAGHGAPASPLAIGGAPVAAPGLGRRELRVLAELLPVAPWAFGFAAVTIATLPGLMRPHVSRPILYSALVILTTLVSGVLVQPLTKRFGPRADLLGLVAGGLGILLGARAVALGSPVLVFVVALLVGAGYGLVMTTGLLEISQRVPKGSRGTAVGIYYVMTYFGFALPFVHATVARHLGDPATLELAAAVTLASLVVRALIESRHRRARRSVALE
jgi:MFS family permease